MQHAKTSRPSRVSSQPSSSHAQAGKTTICHRTGSDTNPWVEITVSNNTVPAHMRHGDQAGGNCPSGRAHARGGQGHEKVTICHRTGSDTNPFVVITIARAGWENGHSKHEGDRIIQPAETCEMAGAQGGAAGQVPTAPCPPAAPVTTTVAGVWHKTGSSKNPFVFITPSLNSAHYDSSKHPEDIVVFASTPTPQAPSVNCAAPPQQAGVGQGAAQPISAPAGVKAGQRAPNAQKAAPRARGVLGVSARQPARALGGRLPFTGFPLWAVALLATMLVATGYALRRAQARVDR